MKLEHADFLARHGGAIAIAAFLAVVVQLGMPQERQYALITGFMALNFGVHAVAMKRWRTEPGLWMLAALAASITGLGYAVFTFPHYLAMLEPAPPVVVAKKDLPGIYQWRWTVDGPVSLVFMWMTFRVTTTLGYWNWHASRMKD